LAAHFVEGFDAADPELISSTSLAEEQEGVGDLEDELQFRVLEGCSASMEYLYRIAIQKRSRFLFNTPVHAAQWRKSHVLIRCTAAGRNESVTAGRCIVTLPIGVLTRESNEIGGIQFTPDIGDKRRAMSGLTMGSVVKVIPQFKEPFWYNKGEIPDRLAISAA
jgi:monoamine oxidase